MVQLTHLKDGMQFRGTWRSCRSESLGTSFGSKNQVQGPAAGFGQPPVPGDEGIESNPGEQQLEVLTNEKLDKTPQCALASQKVNVSWVASKAVWPAGQGRGFCSNSCETLLDYPVHLWSS